MDLNTAASAPSAPEDVAITPEQRRALFWAESRPELSPLMFNILTKYSKIPEDEAIAHVESLRERAWAVFPYPCIGRYRFLTSPLQQHRLYESHILKKLLQEPLPSDSDELASPLYLELGVCFGQEIRALLYQGIPASRLYAADFEPKFIPMGYDLFRDEDKFPPSHQFSPVDIFDKGNFQSNGRLGKFLGKVDILHLTSVFHLWSAEKQIEAARNILPLMRRGGVILGCQTANVKPTEYPSGRGEMMLRHNCESWKDMWLNKVAENGIITDPNTSVHGANVMVNSELVEINRRELTGGVNDKVNTKALNWRDDPGFRWMRYDVWIGADEAQ